MFIRWIFTGILFFAAFDIHAAGPTVEWFQPFHFSPPLANHSRVVIFGRSENGVTVSIDKNLVVTENPALMESFAELQKLDVLQAATDDDRYFQLSITLPQGLVQIPITFAKEDQTVTYLISLQVDKEKFTISVPTSKDDPVIEATKAKLRKFVQKKYGVGLPLANGLTGLWASISLGLSYQIISQSLNQDTNLKFESLDLRAVSARATWNQPKWIANFNYLYQPGKVSRVSQPFTVRSPDYVWSSFLLEAGYNWRNEYFGERSRFTWLAGIQQHQMPSFRINFGNEIQNKSLNITNLSIGPMFTLEMGKNFLLEVFGHYQINMFASTYGAEQFTVKPKLAFDGSVGTIYKMSGRNYFGLFWFGQWHRYDLSFRNAVDQVENSSSESLFYSSLDLRYIRRF